MKKLHKNNKGFTLVELMIVVAIIGILAAIAIPQYMAYVAGSKMKSCASNFAVASSFIAAELKKDQNVRTTNATFDLLRGGKRNPYNAISNAFRENNHITNVANDCRIGVRYSSTSNLQNVAANDVISISGRTGGNAEGTAALVWYNMTVE